MNINGLDHVNIKTVLFDQTVEFYRNVLGLEYLQPASFTDRRLNAWMGVNGQAIIHINGHGEPACRRNPGADGVDHFALASYDITRVRAHLDALGCEYIERALQGRPLRQIVIVDPNGIKVELVFQETIEEA